MPHRCASCKSNFRSLDDLLWHQFHKLCKTYGWPTTKADREADKNPRSEQKLAWKAFRIAVVQAFGATFGTADDDIDAWGRLCRAAGVKSIPKDLEGRRKAVLNPHINLIDLHECGRMGQRAQIFKKEQDLVEYTQDTGRKFPLEEAYQDALLHYLLREIDNDYLGSTPNTA
ncbi:hypothetical protein K440DRAFT_669816 [Wilcoxina mikolae CBS 423.85]|nr:hypothetical protein K440DRAFT_669816 [Wilcoxina mikolae CBS 423.85]